MTDNPYDQFLDEPAPLPLAASGAPNVFDQFDSDPVMPAPVNQTVVPKESPEPPSPLDQVMTPGVSIYNARQAAQTRNEAERDNPRPETPREASFWGAGEHALGAQNLYAYADTLDHVGESAGKQWMIDWASSIRKSLDADKTAYKPIYESYKNVNGLSDAWGYAKEQTGQMVGVMAPSILAALGLGAAGTAVAGPVGGIVGGVTGATAGSIHLHVSDMRSALKAEGLEGDQLHSATNIGAAVLAGLDAVFPTMQAAKLGGFARKAIAEKVAQELAHRIATGGKMATASEFLKQFGKEWGKDVALEVTTEIAQQGVQDLGSKFAAGKPVTAADVKKFATETSVEVAVATAVGAGFISLPGTALGARRDIKEAKAGGAGVHGAPSTPGTVPPPANPQPEPEIPAPAKPTEQELTAPPSAQLDGTPAADEAASKQPQMEDQSLQSPVHIEGYDGKNAGKGVLDFIRDNGGIRPSDDIANVDPSRFPGLVNENGLSADEMRELLVDGGYLRETPTDQDSVTSPSDVYQLIDRAAAGDRVLTLDEQDAINNQLADETRAPQFKLQVAEQQLIEPRLKQYDEQLGDGIMSKVYRGLEDADRIEAIDRVSRGEDIADVLEDMAIRDVATGKVEDTELLQEMIGRRGPDPRLVERMRSMVAQQYPDHLQKFDDLLAELPARQPLPQPKPPAPAREVLTEAASPERPLPAVPVKRSILPGHIVSLFDGSKHEDLRLHLQERGVTPEQYAETFSLPPDYPLQAPNETERQYRDQGDAMLGVSYEEFAKQFTIAGGPTQEMLLRRGAAAEALGFLDSDAFAEDMDSTHRRLEGNPEAMKTFRQLANELSGILDGAASGMELPDMTHAVELATQLASQEPKAKLVTQHIINAAKKMPQPAKAEQVIADAGKKPEAEKPDNNVRFLQLIAGKTPRSQWGRALGLSDVEMKPLIDSAIAQGLLERDTHGVPRRSEGLEQITPENVGADLETAWNAPRDEGLIRWNEQGRQIASRIAALPKKDAIAVAEKFLDRKLTRIEKMSRKDIAATVAILFNERARAEAGLTAAGREELQSFAFPGPIEGGDVTLTDAAAQKAQALQKIAEDAVASILPKNVRIDVQQEIALAKIAREDQLYALRKQSSPEVDNGQLVEGSPEPGGEGGASRARVAAEAAVARSRESVQADSSRSVSGLGTAAEQRILRQESATLRADGTVFAGRQTKGPRTPAGRATASAQPIGKALKFTTGIDGYRGRVTANSLEEVDLVEGNLARLDYDLFPEGLMVTEFTPADATMSVVQRADGAWEIENVIVAMPKQGIGTKLYAAVENDLGIRISPSGILSDQGYAFWKKRSPESVKWHQRTPTMSDESGQFYFSPRKIRSELDRVGREMANIAQGIGNVTNILEAERKSLIDAYRKERGRLIPLWARVPPEARIAIDQMFSLRGFFSPAIRAAEAISMPKGTGEQFLKQITKAPGVKKDELDWIGLEEFLAGKPSVTKDEVIAFMRAHQVVLDEKVLGVPAEGRAGEIIHQARIDAIEDGEENVGRLVTAIDRYISRAERNEFAEPLPARDLQQLREFRGKLVAGEDPDDLAKFGDHKVPGGENYRELLIRLPEIGKRRLTADQHTRLVELQDAQKALRERINMAPFAGTERARLIEEGSRLVAEEDAIKNATKPYVSKHFQDQELVHLRVDDRTGPNGEKVLFINEVQSDLHQEGRRSGYGVQANAEIETQIAAKRARIDEITERSFDPTFRQTSTREQRMALRTETDRLSAEISDLSRRNPPPGAPFKGDLWLELALKRALLYAAENGYNAISWARSDQIAKAVGAVPEKLSLQYDSKIGKFLEKYTKKWGGKVEQGRVAEESFDLLGLTRDQTKILVGALESGGHPDAAEQVKGRGIVLITKDTIRVATEYARKLGIFNDVNPLLRITPEMRTSIPGGQPLYALGDNGVLGKTDPHANLISIGARAIEAEAKAQGKSPAQIAAQVARHEAFEFFKANNIITAPEWDALRRAAFTEGWVENFGDKAKAYADAHPGMTQRQVDDLIVKEAIADKYGAYIKGDYQPKGLIGRVFKRITELLQRLMFGIRREGFQTWEDIFQRMDAGEMKRRYEQIYGTPQAPPREAVAAPPEEAQPMVRAGQIPAARTFSNVTGPAGQLQGVTELLTQLRQALDVSARTGRFSQSLSRRVSAMGGTLLGRYNGTIRTRIARDIDVFSHEAGHHVERIFGTPLRALMNQHSLELTPLGTPGNPLREGFAEFFRRYITNPADARQRAPGFYRDFEHFMDAQRPQLARQLRTVQTAYDRLITGDPVEQGIANQTVIRRTPGSFGNMLSDIERDGMMSTIGDRLHQLYQATVASHHGWWMATRDLLSEIADSTGVRTTLNAVNNPAKLIRMASHTAAWAQRDLKDGIALRYRPNGGGVSMHQVLATAFGGTDRTQWSERAAQEFGEYLIARRAVHLFLRWRPGLRSTVQAHIMANPQLSFLLPRLPANTTSDLANRPTKEPLIHQLTKLTQFERTHPQFRAAAELYYEFNKDIIRLLHEKHLITREERDQYLRDTDYAPFQRDMSDRESVDGEDTTSRRPARARDKVNKRPVYNRIHGSDRDIINPIQSTVQHVYEIRLRAAINDTLRAMDSLARSAGQAGNAIFERLPPTQARMQQVRIREALRDAGRRANMTNQDVSIMLANVENQIGTNAVANIFTQSQASERGEKIVWFFENGKPIPAQLPDGTLGQMMFQSLTQLGERSQDILTKMLALPANVVRTGVTFSPAFIFRNILVDSIVSAVNSPYVTPGLTQLRGLRQVLSGGVDQQLYNRYAGMMGGEHMQSISDQSIERDINALRETGFTIHRSRNIRDFFKMAVQFGEVSESATRVGLYQAVRRSAMADGLSDFDASIEAAHQAHDIMDFSRHGSKTEQLRRSIPFWNAAIQGMDKYVRTLSGSNDYGSAVAAYLNYRLGGGPAPSSVHEQRALAQATRAWGASVLGLGAASLFFAYLSADDPEIDEIPDSIRATHWVIPMRGAYYLLPKSLSSFIGLKSPDTVARIPKPFEMAWFANAVERAFDYFKKSDPTAFQRYLNDFWATISPPDSIPGLDLLYGFISGKDFYNNQDIIPVWEKDLERSEQYGPYTTETARVLGKGTNLAPYYWDYIIRGTLATVGRDLSFIGDQVAGRGPKPDITSYPIGQRFTYNTSRNSKSLSTFYDMLHGREGLNAWFWDTVSSDAKSFLSASATYKRWKDAGQDAQANEFYDRLNPDQKVFATLSVDFAGKKAKLRNLHPIVNAQEATSVVNALVKEAVNGDIRIGKQKEHQSLGRDDMRLVREELRHIQKGMAENALHIIGTPGWAQLQMMDVDKRLDTLKAISPEVHHELMRRLEAKDVQDFKHLKEVWPQVKAHVLAQRGEAQIREFAGGKVPAE